jgi:hypothetical protein
MTGKMKIVKTLLGAWLLMAFAPLVAQTTPEEIYATIEKSGGTYYAYPEVQEDYTPAPEGYEPFYISHYGRHGSRFISDNSYLSVMKILEDADKAGALSEAGRNVRQRLDIVWQEAEGLGNELTPLGIRQHRGIAERMFSHYPEVFRNNRSINASSTVVVRCILSMAAFCERLKELNPSLNVTRASGNRYMRYLTNYRDEAMQKFDSSESGWYEIYNRFQDEHIHPGRLMKLLFTDGDYVQKNIDAQELMMNLYWVASDMQDVESEVSFYDIFEKEELFAIWQTRNFRFYVVYGTSAYGKEIKENSFKPLLQNILDEAGKAIQDHSIAATLRFGHDVNVMSLAGIMELENCYNVENDPDKVYQAWSDFKIAPMAGNIQLIFFVKKNTEDVLVKFLLNEKEVSIPVQSDIKPYYYWQDVEKYYKDKLVEK